MQRSTDSRSPFSIWNLRRNPFGELSAAERAELAVADELNDWLKLLLHPRVALQFVGDCGHGKTTRLLAIHGVLESSTYIYYPESGIRPSLPANRPLLVDEAQRMGLWNLRRLLRGTGPIVLATHVNLAPRLRRAGFHTTSIELNGPIPAETLSRILNRRIEASQLDDHPPLLRIDLSLSEALISKYRANVREMENFLYEHLQSTLSGKSTWPPVI